MSQGWTSMPLHATLSHVWKHHEDSSGKDHPGLAAPGTRLCRSGRLSSYSWVHSRSSSPQLSVLVSRPLRRSLHCRSRRTLAVCCRGPSARCCGAGTAWSLWAPAAGSTRSAALNTAGTESNMTSRISRISLLEDIHLNSAVCSGPKLLLLHFTGRISVPFTSPCEEEGRESKWDPAATKTGTCGTKNCSKWFFFWKLWSARID